MKSSLLKNNNSKAVLIVMFCAILGFAITFFVLNANYMTHSNIPTKLNIIIDNDTSYLNVKETKPLDLKVPGSPIDSSINESEILFHRNPIFMVWSILVVIMITIASGAFPVFIWQSWKLKKVFELNKRQIFFSVSYALILAVSLIFLHWSLIGYKRPPWFIDNFHILLSSGNILIGIASVTMLLELPIIIIVFMIGFALDNLSFDNLNKLSFEKAASQIEFLNKLLQNALQVLSVIVLFSVLTSSALRESIKAAVTVEGFDIFPAETSYVYGMYYSLFLGILYIPTYMLLKYRSRQLQESFIASEDLQKYKDEKWFQNVADTINIKNSALDNLKLSLTVLAPFITSFLPEQLHIFK